MSTRTDVLSSKEVGELISTSQMLLYSLISPIELKQGLITDKKSSSSLCIQRKGQGWASCFLVGTSSPCAGDGESFWFLHVPQECVSVDVITAEPVILVTEIRDGRIEGSQ